MAEIMEHEVDIIMNTKHNIQAIRDNMKNTRNPYNVDRIKTNNLFFNKEIFINNGDSKIINIPRYQPKHFKYNKKCTIIMDNLNVPNATKTTVSLGPKFIYDHNFTKNELDDLSKTIMTVKNNMTIVDFGCLGDLNKAYLDMKYDKIGRCVHMDNNINKIRGYLRQCLYTTTEFFKNFPDIITVTIDKGNCTAILNKSTYHLKMMQHIKGGVDKGVYTPIEINSNIITNQKAAYTDMINIYNDWIHGESNSYNKKLSIPNNYNFHTAPIYGTLKLHKKDVPIRPIVADYLNPLKTIHKKLKGILNLYINKERFPFIIGNTNDIIDKCKLNINKNHIMTSLDYSSMYTNIDLNNFYDIIDNEYEVTNNIKPINLEKTKLIKLFKHTINEFSYITYNDNNNHIHTFKQTKGIPMGGALSFHIAETVTSRHMEALLNKIPKHSISGLYKYVDDILVLSKDNIINDATLIKKCLNNMAYEITMEDDKQSIIFLNLNLQRKNNRILHKWYSKPYASGRTLNYYSQQPDHMKVNIIKQLYLTIDKACSHKKTEGIEKFNHIMKINNYPKKFIAQYIKS